MEETNSHHVPIIVLPQDIAIFKQIGSVHSVLRVFFSQFLVPLQWRSQPKILGRAHYLILGEWLPFIWNTASQSTKWLFGRTWPPEPPWLRQCPAAKPIIACNQLTTSHLRRMTKSVFEDRNTLPFSLSLYCLQELIYIKNWCWRSPVTGRQVTASMLRRRLCPCLRR